MGAGLLQAGVGLVGGGIEALIGYHQRKKAQAQVDMLQGERPKWTPSPYENQMLTLAESQGGTGMSDASKAAYLNNAQSGLSSTINAIEKGGGDVNSLGNAYGKYQGGLGQIAMYDDQARQAHLANIMTQYGRQSANADKGFMFNQYAPWTDKMQAANQQLAGANNMFQSGINTALGGLVGGIGAASQQSQVNNAGGGGGGQQGGGAETPQGPGNGGGNNTPQYMLPPMPDYSAMNNAYNSYNTQTYTLPQTPVIPGGGSLQGGDGANSWGWNN